MSEPKTAISCYKCEMFGNCGGKERALVDIPTVSGQQWMDDAVYMCVSARSKRYREPVTLAMPMTEGDLSLLTPEMICHLQFLRWRLERRSEQLGDTE